MEVALKTTLRASSQQGSGLSITTVSCSIIIRYLRGSALALFMQSWFIETLVASCWANLWNFSSFRGDFLFLHTKELIRILTSINVMEDKMTNHWGLQIGKPSLTCCVPVLLRVSRRLKQENILLDVGEWYHNPLKNVACFIILWSISRYNLNWDFMFLENKSKLCKCRANQIFWRIRLRQPVWSYTPITIIPMISWAGMSVDKIFIFLLPCFVIIIQSIRCSEVGGTA